MAVGLVTDVDEDGELGILIAGHMFALPLDGAQCGSKRARAEDSQYMNALDIGPYRHFEGDAIESDFGWCNDCFSDASNELELHPAVLEPVREEFDFASAILRTSSAVCAQPATKKVKVSPGDGPSKPQLENTFVVVTLEPKPILRTSSSASAGRTPDMANNVVTEAEAAAAAAAAQAEQTQTRGENVRKNPQMQKTARAGQKHWHDKVQDMRIQYDLAHTGMVHAQFAEQRFMCTVRNLKCQKESLLIFLQFAMQQRLISPLSFVHPGNETGGFLGWTGFRIHRGCGPSFRAGVEGLFPEPPKLNTLYHLFRRSGLVPEDWRRAWDGEIAFTWNPARVS